MTALFSFNKRTYRARNKITPGASHKPPADVMSDTSREGGNIAIAISWIKFRCNLENSQGDEIFRCSSPTCLKQANEDLRDCGAFALYRNSRCAHSSSELTFSHSFVVEHLLWINDSVIGICHFN